MAPRLVNTDYALQRHTQNEPIQSRYATLGTQSEPEPNLHLLQSFVIILAHLLFVKKGFSPDRVLAKRTQSCRHFVATF